MIQTKMLILLIVITLTYAKLYNVAPEADLAYVRRQLTVLAHEYAHGVPATDATRDVWFPLRGNQYLDRRQVCVPTPQADDGRQRAYIHARHLFRHHGIASVDYESYREYLQHGGHGKYDNRFCMSVADLSHIGRVLERGELVHL